MAIDLRVTEDLDDLRSAFELRYKALVAEHGPDFEGLDHESGQLCDNLDASSRIVVAVDRGQVVGTQRITLGSESSFAPWDGLLDMPKLGEMFPHSVSLSSRLAVDRAYQKTTLAMRLAVRCYQEGVNNGVCVDFMYCRSKNRRLFERFGYQEWMPERELPGLGMVIPMVLYGYDRDMLEQARSPFAKYCMGSVRCC